MRYLVVLALLVVGCAAPAVSRAPLSSAFDLTSAAAPGHGLVQTASPTLGRGDVEAWVRKDCRRFAASAQEPIVWTRRWDPTTNKIVEVTAPPMNEDACVATILKWMSAPRSDCVMPAPGEPIPDCMRVDLP